MPAFMNNNKVVSIADAITNFRLSFQKLIKFIHINVYEELACKITEWQADAGPILRMKTVDDFAQEPCDIAIFNASPQNIFQGGIP